jgi:hypothetical protein
MAIHWGTWDLSHEQLSEPATMLAEARDVVGLTKEQFDVVDLGASISSVPAAAAFRDRLRRCQKRPCTVLVPCACAVACTLHYPQADGASG